MQKTILGKKGKETVKAYTLMFIPIAWWCVFFLVPLIMAAYFSFSNLRLSVDKISKFGLFNYAYVLKDADFWNAFKNTAIWTAVMLIGNNFFGLLMAVLVSRLKKSARFFIALLFWPTLVSAVIGSVVTKGVFSAAETGLMNAIIGIFGAAPVAWLEQESTALFSLMVMPFLFGFCIKMLIYYTAILSIPRNYYEAYSLESSNPFKKFWYITFPLIRNAFTLNILLSLIDGLKVLGPMQLITGGANDTNSCVLYLYNFAFGGGTQMGRAAAAGFVLFAIILVISLLQMYLTRKGGETYE